MFPQRVLVALETDHGVEYVTASGWDRVYLFWMFRNFRSLPQNVLSARQKRLIGSLYRETSNYNSDDLHGAAVTRVVEVRKPQAKPPTERVENVSADEAVTRIVDWLAARKLV